MLTKELKKSNDNLVVHGKIIVYLSTNISTPIQNPGHTAAASPALNDHSTDGPNATGSTLNASSSSQAGSSSSRPNSLVPPATEAARVQTPTPAPAAQAPSPVVPQGSQLGGGAVPQHSSGVAAASAVGHQAGSNPATAAANRNFDPHSDQHGPLPGNWERRMDHLGRQYCESHPTAKLARTRRPRSDADVARPLSFSLLADVDHNTRTTTWNRYVSSNHS